MNDVCLFYKKYAKQLQQPHYTKRKLFLYPKGERWSQKLTKYKADTHMEKSDMSHKEKSELQKGID